MTRGDVITEIETDKATVDKEGLAPGTRVEIVPDAGAEVTVGVTIDYPDDEA